MAGIHGTQAAKSRGGMHWREGACERPASGFERVRTVRLQGITMEREPARATDKRMPVEDLPYPLGWRRAEDPADDQRLSGLRGDQAVFELLLIRPEGDVPTVGSLQEHWGRLSRQVFAGLKTIFGELTEIEGGPMGSPASMTNADEFARFGEWQWTPSTDEDAHFFVFRSRDGEWAGFRSRDECFRFRRSSLLGFTLDVAIPARWIGYFQVWAVCASCNASGADAKPNHTKGEYFVLDKEWTTALAFELACVMTTVANFLGVPLTIRKYVSD
ncbi:hypothetical protein [Burkholderia sp. F1]|uniref:hypothetical protein n=1 Tax=Burkholderia sp. F1 TaxID=3366817 RepID=UPI003D722A54